MKNFALTGAAGFVAPRHMKAINDTGNRLVAACDPHDSVGTLDRYSLDVRFFTEFERFDRHLDKLRRGPAAERVQYVSICSPNHLHDAHIRTALRIGADAICEKPIVLNPWNLDALHELETETGGRVWTVLQLRLHPSLMALKKRIDASSDSRRHRVTLRYVTARGVWYHHSWKGSVEKSGGVATNIGVHLFDLLIWLFGAVQSSSVDISTPHHIAGTIELANADVEWFLSISAADLPSDTTGRTTFRSIVVDGTEIEFSEGFNDLHTRVYEEVLEGRGFGIEDARPSIELVHRIRTQPVSGGKPSPVAEVHRG